LVTSQIAVQHFWRDIDDFALYFNSGFSGFLFDAILIEGYGFHHASLTTDKLDFRGHSIKNVAILGLFRRGKSRLTGHLPVDPFTIRGDLQTDRRGEMVGAGILSSRVLRSFR